MRLNLNFDLQTFPPQQTTDNYNLKHVISSVAESDFSDQYKCKIEFSSVSVTSELSELKKIGKTFNSELEIINIGKLLVFITFHFI